MLETGEESLVNDNAPDFMPNIISLYPQVFQAMASLNLHEQTTQKAPPSRNRGV